MAAVYPCGVKRNQMRLLHLENVGETCWGRKIPQQCLNGLTASGPGLRLPPPTHISHTLPPKVSGCLRRLCVKRTPSTMSINSSENEGSSPSSPNLKHDGKMERRAEGLGPEKQHASLLPSEPHRTKPLALPPPPRPRLELNVPLP